MNPRLAHLVLALRLAYVIGAVLFLLDVVLAIVAPAIVGATPDGADDATLDSLTSWIALIAFGCAAVGAIVTVAASADGRAPAPHPEDEETRDPAL